MTGLSFYLSIYNTSKGPQLKKRGLRLGFELFPTLTNLKYPLELMILSYLINLLHRDFPQGRELFYQIPQQIFRRESGVRKLTVQMNYEQSYVDRAVATYRLSLYCNRRVGLQSLVLDKPKYVLNFSLGSIVNHPNEISLNRHFAKFDL